MPEFAENLNGVLERLAGFKIFTAPPVVVSDGEQRECLESFITNLGCNGQRFLGVLLCIEQYSRLTAEVASGLKDFKGFLVQLLSFAMIALNFESCGQGMERTPQVVPLSQGLKHRNGLPEKLLRRLQVASPICAFGKATERPRLEKGTLLLSRSRQNVLVNRLGCRVFLPRKICLGIFGQIQQRFLRGGDLRFGNCLRRGNRELA